MNIDKVLRALVLKQDASGNVVGVEFVDANDLRVQAVLEKVKTTPANEMQLVDAGDEYKNIACVVADV